MDAIKNAATDAKNAVMGKPEPTVSSLRRYPSFFSHTRTECPPRSSLQVIKESCVCCFMAKVAATLAFTIKSVLEHTQIPETARYIQLACFLRAIRQRASQFKIYNFYIEFHHPANT